LGLPWAGLDGLWAVHDGLHQVGTKLALTSAPFGQDRYSEGQII